LATDVKPRSNRLLMVLGLVLAVVAFILVIVLHPGGGGGSTNSGSANNPVVVAKLDIPVGTPITGDLLTTVNYSSGQLPDPTVYFSAVACGPKSPPTCKSPVGQFANIAIPKNAPILSSALVATSANLQPVKKPYLDIPKGLVALPIPAGGELQAAAGYIQPGDHVDLLVQAAGTTGWKIAEQNIVIQRVGNVATNQGQGLASMYMVYVDPAKAELLTALFANSTYKYLLRSQEDITAEPTFNTPGVKSADIISKYNLPK
jgi:Flp pilus assembly protein CpaB